MATLDDFIELRAAAAEAFGGHGLLGCRQLAEALDDALRSLAAPTTRPGLALVALGSYGRRELCRHSDIDLIVLLEGDSADALTAAFYPLGDAGLKLAHSVRYIEEAVTAGRRDLERLTSLLDARLVWGDERFTGVSSPLGGPIHELAWTEQELFPAGAWSDAQLLHERLELVLAVWWRCCLPASPCPGSELPWRRIRGDVRDEPEGFEVHGGHLVVGRVHPLVGDTTRMQRRRHLERVRLEPAEEVSGEFRKYRVRERSRQPEDDVVASGCPTDRDTRRDQR